MEPKSAQSGMSLWQRGCFVMMVISRKEGSNTLLWSTAETQMIMSGIALVSVPFQAASGPVVCCS